MGGENYGQGSSREHAALVPLYLGIRCVIAKSFARIHAANLVNAGILPLTFGNAADYDALAEGTELTLSNIYKGMESGEIAAMDACGNTYCLKCEFSPRQVAILKAGGLLSYTKEGGL